MGTQLRQASLLSSPRRPEVIPGDTATRTRPRFLISFTRRSESFPVHFDGIAMLIHIIRTIMPRRKTKTKPKTKRKLTRDELKARLEEESPGITDRIPPVASFKFFTDRTTQENVYVKVGDTKVDNTKVGDAKIGYTLYPVYVGLGDITGNRMIFFNVGTLYPERIIHENKELSRIGTIYSTPFNRLVPLRYEYPSSIFSESLQWFIELRALTTFAFVWCGHRDEFFDFNKGEGFRVLVEVLERHPKATGAAVNRDSRSGAQKSAEAKGLTASVEFESIPGIVADADTDPEVDANKKKEKEVDTEDNIGVTVSMPATIISQRRELDIRAPESLISKKRTHGDFATGQKD